MKALVDCLRDHRLPALFIDVLGWESATGTMTLTADGQSLAFRTIAQKRGLRVFWCSTDRLVLMNRGLLRKLQRLVARTTHEHILIFTSEEPRKQVWQWAIRLADGRKVRHREHPFFSATPPLPLLNRLGQLRFTLDEEDSVTLVDALDRVRLALDVQPELNLFARYPSYARRSDELARAMRRGEAGAFQQFIVFHRPLARRFSRRLSRWFGLPEEDAEQIGVLGLIEAARRFDPERGNQFSTYATWWIRQACQRYGPDVALLIRLPDYVFWSCYRLSIDLSRVLQAEGPEGFRARLHDLELLNPLLARRWHAYLRARSVVSLSDRKQPAYREARLLRGPAPDPLEAVNRANAAALVWTALERLAERDARILRLRYGLDGEKQTLGQIGELLNLTRERVRQIQLRAEEKLRRILGAESPLPAPASLPREALAVEVPPDLASASPDGCPDPRPLVFPSPR